MDQIEESFREMTLGHERGYSIREILVKNFKSFGPTECSIGPFIDMTSIVGPNGTGKSNIVEALQFVMKDSWQFQEVSHNNNKESVSVKVRLQKGPWKDMNSNGQWWQSDWQVELCKVAHSEDKIGYYLNGRGVEQSEYEEKLAEWLRVTVVNQNMYQELINKKAEELRLHLEKASGSIVFKKEHDQLQSEATGLREEHCQLVERQLQIRERKRHAKNNIQNRKEYQELGVELDTLEKQVEMLKFLEIELKLRGLEKQQQKQENLREEFREEGRQIEGNITTVRGEMEEHSAQHLEEQKTAEQQREQRDATRQALESCISGVEQREKVKHQLLRQIGDITLEEKQLKEVEQTLQAALEQQQRQQQERERVQKMLQEDSAFNSLWEEHQKDSDDLARGKQRQKVDELKQSRREVARKVEQRKEKRAEERKEQEQRESMAKQRKELEKEGKKLEKQIGRMEKEQEGLESKIKKGQEDMAKGEERLKQKKREQEQSETGEETRRMRAELQKIESYKGRVLELYQVVDSEKHGPAVRLVLSGDDGTLVLGRHRDLLAVQDILNEYNVRLKVIILEALAGYADRKAHFNRLRQQLDGSEQMLAIDLVEYDPGMQPLFNYLLEDTAYISCEAKRCPGISRQITREGLLFTPKGLVVHSNPQARHLQKIQQVKQTDLLNLKNQLQSVHQDYNSQNQEYLRLEMDKETLLRQLYLLQQHRDQLSPPAPQPAPPNRDDAALETRLAQLDQELEQAQEALRLDIQKTVSFQEYSDKERLQLLLEHKQQPLSYKYRLQQQVEESERQLVQLSHQQQLVSDKMQNRRQVLQEQSQELEQGGRERERLQAELEQQEVGQVRNSQAADLVSLEYKLQKEKEKVKEREEKSQQKLTTIRSEQQRARNKHQQLYEEIQMKRMQLDVEEQLVVQQSQVMEEGGVRLLLDYTGMGVNGILKVDDWQQGVSADQVLRAQRNLDVLIREKTVLFHRHTSSLAAGAEPGSGPKEKQQEVNELQLKERLVQQEIEEKLSQTKEREARLLGIQEQRGDAFRSLFERVQQLVEPIYRQLSSSHGSASLFLENNKQPYLQGVVYQTTPPNKRFIFDIGQLSGGEKTISQLALLVAISLAQGHHIVIFDEIDAHLDADNTQQILGFFKNQLVAHLSCQVLLVTHQEALYGQSHSLVGVTVAASSSVAYSLLL